MSKECKVQSVKVLELETNKLQSTEWFSTIDYYSNLTHPELMLDWETKVVINDILMISMKSLIKEAKELRDLTLRKLINVLDMECAIRLHFGCLGKRFSAFGEKAMTLIKNGVYVVYMKVTVCYIVYLKHYWLNYLKGYWNGKLKIDIFAFDHIKMRDNPKVYMLSCLEAFACELLEIAGNICKDLKKHSINCNHLNIAIKTDEEIGELFGNKYSMLKMGAVPIKENENLCINDNDSWSEDLSETRLEDENELKANVKPAVKIVLTQEIKEFLEDEDEIMDVNVEPKDCDEECNQDNDVLMNYDDNC